MIDPEFYWEHGYGIVRDVFTPVEISEMSNGFDRLKEEGANHPRSYRHRNEFFAVREDPVAGRILRFMHWPSYRNEVLARYRTDRRLLAIVEPLIGNNLKQIVNTLVWKAPKTSATTYAYHQDAKFRVPAEAFDDLAGSYVQTATAIDAHTPESGCVRLLPGSHKLGSVEPRPGMSIMDGGFDETLVGKLGIDPDSAVDVALEPGDVAFWHPHMLHGSGANHTEKDRRSYLNGFVTAPNAERGEWAFRDGSPVPLGEPVLVQYEDLFARPEPHYVD